MLVAYNDVEALSWFAMPLLEEETASEANCAASASVTVVEAVVIQRRQIYVNNSRIK